MKYYSDILNLLFEKEEDLKLAEKQHLDAKKTQEEIKKKKEQEKKARKVEIEQTLKDAETANEKAEKLLNKYVKDYGYFSSTFSSDDKNCDTTVYDTHINLTDSDISEFVNILTSFLKN